MNESQKLWLLRSVKLIAGLTLLPISACAIFSARHRAWERDILREEDGVAAFARDFHLGRGDTAILLIHGFGDGPHVWEHLAHSLASRGFAVRAMRLPGWGEPMDVKRNITRDHWLESIQHEIALLREDHQHVVVLAHSLGGCLSAYLAQQDRLDADALRLYAPMFAVAKVRSPLLTPRRWFTIGRAILPERMIVESLFEDHTQTRDPRPRTRRDPFVPIRLFAVLYDTMDAFHSMDPHLSMPVSLVLPGEDRVVRSSVSRDWFERLQAPRKTLHLEPDAGHVLPWDLDPHQEADRIFLWLKHELNGNPL